MAAITNARVAFARRFRSATNVILADSNSNDIADEHNPAHVLPFHEDPIVLTDRAGQNDPSNDRTVDSDYLDRLSSQPSNMNSGFPEISGRNNRSIKESKLCLQLT